MLWRNVIFVLLFASMVGCKPARATRDNSLDANSGINIVPGPIVAAEKMSPDTARVDDSRPDLVNTVAGSRYAHEDYLRLIRMADLVPEFQQIGPYTLLAPTDEAFNKLPPGLVDRLCKPENKEQLRAFLMYHTLKGRIGLKDLQDTNGQVSTMQGGRVVIRGVDSKVMINDANVLRADNSPSNGTIYWIDGVLFPPS